MTAKHCHHDTVKVSEDYFYKLLVEDADDMVSDIIEELKHRKGFNAFWDDIYSDIKLEIMHNLRKVILPYLEGWAK